MNLKLSLKVGGQMSYFLAHDSDICFSFVQCYTYFRHWHIFSQVVTINNTGMFGKYVKCQSRNAAIQFYLDSFHA